MEKPVLGILLCVILLAACATPQQAPDRKDDHVLPPSVTVIPFSIKPHLVEGEEAPPLPGELLQALSSEATASAVRTLARRVEVTPEKTVNVPGYRVTGVVRVPIVLPQDDELHREIGRSEPFVTAAVTLQGPDGKAIRTVHGILAWEDLHDPEGAPVPSDRLIGDVLRDAVRQAVEEAVTHLGPEGAPTRENP